MTLQPGHSVETRKVKMFPLSRIQRESPRRVESVGNGRNPKRHRIPLPKHQLLLPVREEITPAERARRVEMLNRMAR
jgi:hypothetical protein